MSDELKLDTAQKRNRAAYNKFKVEFQEVFKVPLDDYWRGDLSGLDIVKFDAEVLKSGDKSCLSMAKKKFGKRGADLLQLFFN